MQTETTSVAEALTVGECIARSVMPQVDEEDLPELLEFLKGRGITHIHRMIDPKEVKGQQRVTFSKVRGIVKAGVDLLANKPSLVALDRLIVDGNHRIASYHVVGKQAPILLFNMVFSELLPVIFEFPKTYAYGDGKFHPVRN